MDSEGAKGATAAPEAPPPDGRGRLASEASYKTASSHKTASSAATDKSDAFVRVGGDRLIIEPWTEIGYRGVGAGEAQAIANNEGRLLPGDAARPGQLGPGTYLGVGSEGRGIAAAYAEFYERHPIAGDPAGPSQILRVMNGPNRLIGREVFSVVGEGRLPAPGEDFVVAPYPPGRQMVIVPDTVRNPDNMIRGLPQ